MGAAQVLEPIMDKGKKTVPEKPRYDHLVREAVSDIPSEIMALGGTQAQGEAMAEAMCLVLMGEDDAKVRQAYGHHFILNKTIL